MAFPTPPGITGILINGTTWDASSIEMTIDGLIVNSIQEISYNASMDVAYLRGFSSEKLGRTRGQYNADGSLSMYKPDAQALIAQLAAKNLGGYMEATFSIKLVFKEGATVITDSLEGCRIIGDEDSHSQGSEALMTTFQLDIMKIYKGGIGGSSGGLSGAGAAGAAVGGLIGGSL